MKNERNAGVVGCRIVLSLSVSLSLSLSVSLFLSPSPSPDISERNACDEEIPLSPRPPTRPNAVACIRSRNRVYIQHPDFPPRSRLETSKIWISETIRETWIRILLRSPIFETIERNYFSRRRKPDSRELSICSFFLDLGYRYIMD